MKKLLTYLGKIMGVIVNKNNFQNDELSRKINADLKGKMDGATLIEEGEDPDFVEDSEYVKDLNKTSKFGWVWVVLVGLAILSLILIVFGP